MPTKAKTVKKKVATKPPSAKQLAARAAAKIRMQDAQTWLRTNRKVGESYRDAMSRYFAL